MPTARKHAYRGTTRARRVSATEAAKHFGQLVDRVREERITYVIERSGTPVARIGPVERLPFTLADFKALLDNTPQIGEEYVRGVEEAIARHNRPRIRRSPWAR